MSERSPRSFSAILANRIERKEETQRSSRTPDETLLAICRKIETKQRQAVRDIQLGNLEHAATLMGLIGRLRADALTYLALSEARKDRQPKLLTRLDLDAWFRLRKAERTHPTREGFAGQRDQLQPLPSDGGEAGKPRKPFVVVTRKPRFEQRKLDGTLSLNSHNRQTTFSGGVDTVHAQGTFPGTLGDWLDERVRQTEHKQHVPEPHQVGKVHCECQLCATLGFGVAS